MLISRFSRSLRLVVRPILGCVLVATFAIPAAAQAPVVRLGTAVQRRPFALWSESAHNLRDSLVAVARAQIGTRYVLGGTSPKGFDCSGLVRYVMAALKVELPRTAAQQARIGDEVVHRPDPAPSRRSAHLRRSAASVASATSASTSGTAATSTPAASPAA